MMRLQYEITEEDYVGLVAFRIRLKNRSAFQRIRYVLTNVLFGALAVYFFVARPDYPVYIRLAPFAMEAALLVLSSYPRIRVEARARRAVKSYIEDGTLQKGYIGPHLLTIQGGSVKLRYGGRWSDIGCGNIAVIRPERELAGMTLLVADGAIFEAVPDSALDRDGNREKLKEAIEAGWESAWQERLESARGRLEGECRAELSWELSPGRYIEDRQRGFRNLYRTRCGWDNSQIIRALIMAYGAALLLGGWNRYLGGAFVLLGLWLNRQLILAMMPVAWTTDGAIGPGGAAGGAVLPNSAAGGSENPDSAAGGSKSPDGGTGGAGGAVVRGRAYLSDRQLILAMPNQVQQVLFEQVASVREADGCVYLYTREKAMLMLPREAFRSNHEKDYLLARARGGTVG